MIYTIASVAIGLSHPFFDKIINRKEYVPLSRTNLIIGFIGLGFIWSASGILPFSSVTVALMLLPFSILLWLKLDGTRESLIIALVTAFFGCLTEIILSYTGFFYHTHQDILGIPYWLPVIYISASTGLGNIGRWLANNKN